MLMTMSLTFIDNEDDGDDDGDDVMMTLTIVMTLIMMMRTCFSLQGAPI